MASSSQFLSTIIGYIIPFGSHNDPIGKEGLANFLVDSYSYGTKQFPSSNDLFIELESTGARFSAEAGRENLYIYISVPRENLRIAESLLDEIINNPSTTEEEFERIRVTLLAKIAEIKADSLNYAVDLFGELTLPERPQLGTEESLNNISYSDLLKMQKKVTKSKYRYSISSSDSFQCDNFSVDKRPRSHFPKSPTTRYIFNEKEQEQKSILYGYRTGGDADNPLVLRNVAKCVMSSGLMGLVFEEIREKRSLAYYAGYMHDSFAQKGYSSIYAGVSEANLPDVLELMDSLYNRVSTGDFEDTRIDIAKQYFWGKVIRLFDSLESIASLSLVSISHGLEIPTLSSIEAELKTISKDEIISHFQKFTTGNSYFVVNGNTTEETKDKLKNRLLESVK